jgi:hypothetical protein
MCGRVRGKGLFEGEREEARKEVVPCSGRDSVFGPVWVLYRRYVDLGDRGGRRGIVSPRRRQSVPSSMIAILQVSVWWDVQKKEKGRDERCGCGFEGRVCDLPSGLVLVLVGRHFREREGWMLVCF